jgi:hypothetical protein
MSEQPKEIASGSAEYTEGLRQLRQRWLSERKPNEDCFEWLKRADIRFGRLM